MIKKLVGKLKVSSDNTLSDLLVKRDWKNMYKNFNIECVLTPASWSKFNIGIESGKFWKFSTTFNKELINQMVFERVLTNEELQKKYKAYFEKQYERELSKIDAFERKLSKGEGVFLHGFTRINDRLFYSIGVTHGAENYKVFLLNGKFCASLTMVGKVAGNNATLNKTMIGDGYYDEYCCGFGEIKNADLLKDVDIVENSVLFGGLRCIVDNNTLISLRNLIKENEPITDSYENTENAFLYNTYMHYEIAEKIDPYEILVKLEKEICDRMQEKYGLRYYSEVTFDQKQMFKDDDIANYFDKIRGEMVKESLKNLKVKRSKDTNSLIEGAFCEILYTSFYGNENVGMSLAKELSSNYQFQENVCKYDAYHYYIDSLMEILHGKEGLVKDVLTLFNNAEKILCLTPTDIYQKQIISDKDFETKFLSEGLGIDMERSFTTKASSEYLNTNLKTMGFNNAEIKELLVAYDTYSEIEDVCFSELSCLEQEAGKITHEDKILIKANEITYKKLVGEFAKRIVGNARKKNRDIVRKDKNFLEITRYRNGKVVKKTEAEKPKVIERETATFS